MIRLRTLFAMAALVLSGAAAGAPPLPVPLGEPAPPVYVCPPCPHVDDLFHTRTHDAPGICPVCGMALVERPVRAAQAPAIHDGSGAFRLRVGPDLGREVDVFYYRPAGLTGRAPVLIVLPGAGRNAWEYRDHWIEAADRHGVLVLALHYPEGRYPRFWNYNLAGMIGEVVIDPAAQALAGYRIRRDPAQWLFGDVDAVFQAAVRSVGLQTDRYDLFGHSAGGQFLHRFAMFAGNGTRADRILASNSGWYTVPDREARFPFGLEGLPLTDAQLRSAFARRLVVFLGGDDDEGETRGDLVRSAQTDLQGHHRLARGLHFHGRAADAAARLDADFNWTRVVVPGVGHDAKGMTQAAARYLYDSGQALERPD